MSRVEEPRLYKLISNDAWCDAGAEVSIKDIKDTHKPHLIETIGWLLLSDEEGVSIANEKTDPYTYRGRTFVLRGMVVSLVPYRQPRQRKPKPPAVAIPGPKPSLP